MKRKKSKMFYFDKYGIKKPYKKKKNKHLKTITEAVATQTAVVTLAPLPYRIAGAGSGLGTQGQTAMAGALRTMRPVAPIMGMIPTVQVSKGLLGAIGELEKIGKKKRR